MPKRIRVLIARLGMDAHWRGSIMVARALRDAGMEVIYTGLRQTPSMVAETAMQEDVDLVGLSILSGAHMTLLPRIMALLRENEMEEVPVFVGGIIPEDDAAALRKLGVVAIFGPGSSLEDISRSVWEIVERE